MDRKQRFNQIYANLPISSREEIILVINDEPITWKVARLYIEQDTKLGEEILQKLVKLGII
ncbi:hypothetical protein A2V71_01475 [Candidatus Berkelbacteria bacterium RBG_13_40_8]|uniref:Uncharacterized protein n=1 Tax=Candidatus Berkelbacteria bacterium RBG_13_40_8 TaxID=1797467 RepID=A0A1F5DNZ6_9BACT|nr:MAG: hypothetical protein A2V71_01475 [Candidatus Berkelbacteria bacterium RBG_13_40_8]